MLAKQEGTSGIVNWSNVEQFELVGNCIICEKDKPLQELSAGARYRDGYQAFACYAHMWNRGHWLSSWIKFELWEEIMSALESNGLHDGMIHPAPRPGWFVERQPTENIATTIRASLIANHLFPRKSLGITIVVTDQAFSLMRVTRKEWLKMSRALQRLRASTTDGAAIEAISKHIELMERIKFALHSPAKTENADVHYIEPQRMREVNDDVSTIYLCSELSDKQTTALLEQLPDGCVLVDCRGDLTV